MAAETGASFAGVRCRCTRLARSRGYDPDVALIEVPVGTADGFSFEPAGPQQATGPLEVRVPEIAGRTQARKRARGGAWPATARVVFGGTLTIWEVDDAGQVFQVTAHPMFVKSASRARQSVTGEEVWQVTLVDERLFWGRGFMRTWTFNRLRANGTAAADSLKPDGSAWKLADVAALAVGSLPRTPKLAAYPSQWAAGSCGPLELSPYCPGLSALRVLEDEHHVQPPCLRWDATVALHQQGDGRMGYAKDGKGGNTSDLPPEFRLWKGGTGNGRTIEPTWPDDYVVVRGRERIATVALDGWEPVLVLRARRKEGGPQSASAKDVEPADGDEVGAPRVFPLNDETVQGLSKGRLTLDGLRRWVLQPLAYQDAVGLDENVARLFREQAWRLWRVPEAVIQVTGTAKGPDGKAMPFVTEEPGPNAHLLPLLDRAETIAGRRVPPTVQTYRFRTRHRTLSGVDSRQKALAGSRARKQTIREKASSIARLNNKRDPFAGKIEVAAAGSLSVSELLGDKIALTGDASVADLQRAIDAQRVADSIRDVDAGVAGEYEAELDAEAKAAEELTGAPERALRSLAKKAAALERQIKEAANRSSLQRVINRGRIGGVLEQAPSAAERDFGVNDEARRLRELFRESIAEELRALQRAADEAQTRERAGVTAAQLLPEERGPTFVQNAKRTEDTGARVYSHELGVIQVSRLPGHVEKEGVPSPADTRFVPQPVRVLFGAVVRPKITAVAQPTTLQTQVRGQQGQAGAAGGDLKDGVTWFVRAFKRVAPGEVAPIPVEDVPPGEGTVVPIEEHELIPLVEAGNTAALEQKALEIARDRCRPQPVVQSGTHVGGRPWPVQPDGVVRSVEIVERADGKGYETRVVVGLGSVDPNPMRTRTRPPTPKDRGDGGRREGTNP